MDTFDFTYNGYSLTAQVIYLDGEPQIALGSTTAPIEVLTDPAARSAAVDALGLD